MGFHEREVRMLYVVFTLIMMIAGLVLLFTLMSRRSVREGTRVAKEMVKDEEVVVPRGTEGVAEPQDPEPRADGPDREEERQGV